MPSHAANSAIVANSPKALASALMSVQSVLRSCGVAGRRQAAASPFAGRALPTGTGGIRDAGEKIQDRSLHRYEYRSEQAAVVPRP